MHCRKFVYEMELGMTCKEVENSKLNINPIIVPGGLLDTKGFC